MAASVVLFTRTLFCKTALKKPISKAVQCNYSPVRFSSTKEAKRFYKNVSISKTEGGYEVNLDKYKLKTPMGKLFQVPSEALAIGVATEWDAQDKTIKRHTMHLTSLANTAIDNPMMRTKDALINATLDFLDTDTICYRVEDPPELVDRQQKEWNPVLDSLQKRYEVELKVTTNFAVPQIPAATRDIFRQHLNSYNHSALIGYQKAAESIKSFVISTAVIDRELTVEHAVQLARLELDFQISQWGRVEWHHDVDEYEQRSRLAAAVIFVHVNSNETKTVFDKHARHDQGYLK